jgi:hypothetical protein
MRETLLRADLSHLGHCPVKHNQLNVEIDNLQAALKHSTDRPSGKAVRVASTEQPVCQEWVQLVTQYRASVKAYSDATAELSGTPGAGFNRAWMRAESLREASKSFRAALFEHEHKHGCSVVHARCGSLERD